ncbi:hypothetical protein A5733_02145 [Mycobacterium sp. NS-7484]|nr:hypothetical protein A5733_02145 [Mycobacterium sp. NS-7484]
MFGFGQMMIERPCLFHIAEHTAAVPVGIAQQVIVDTPRCATDQTLRIEPSEVLTGGRRQRFISSCL